jgi:hypothetical protein
MTARKSKTKVSDPAAPTPLEVIVQKDETKRQAIARKLTGPFTRHGLVAGEVCARLVGSFDNAAKPDLVEYATAIMDRAEKAATGDLKASSVLLMAQALSLDGIFAEYARIALVNVGSHMDASERYMRLALKAQANSRATLEALARLHQPREQTVRHVHVNEGGQAVIADQFHHYAGGQENGQSVEQPHATGTAGAGPALPGPDPLGEPVPVASREGEPAMQDARRQGKRRA